PDVAAADVQAVAEPTHYQRCRQVGRNHRERPALPLGVAQAAKVEPQGWVRAVGLTGTVQAPLGCAGRPAGCSEVMQPAPAGYSDRWPAHDVAQPVQVMTALGQDARPRLVRAAPVAPNVRVGEVPPADRLEVLHADELAEPTLGQDRLHLV